MRFSLVFCCLWALSNNELEAQIYSPVSVTGFNHDVVAEGIGNSTLSTTTKEMDAIPISNYVLCTKEFASANDFMPNGIYGLPEDGMLTSLNRTYKIAPFNGNQVSYLLSSETGKLTLNEPTAFSNISLLCLATEGTANLTVTFKFEDSTSQTSTVVIPDWFNITSPFSGYGRVKRKNGPLVFGSDYEAAPNGKPGLMPLDFTLPCTKRLVYISLANSSSGTPSSSNRAFVFAVSGLASIIPSVAVSTFFLVVCEGFPVTFTATPTNGGTTPIYVWYVNGQPTGQNSPVFTTSTLPVNPIITCSLTSNINCAAPPIVSSPPISVTIIPKLTPTLNVTVSDTSVCAGIPVNFTAVGTNGGASPTYQWLVNGVNVPGISSSLIRQNPDSGEVVRCMMASSEICVSVDTAVSKSIKLHVTPVYSISINPVDSLYPVAQSIPLLAMPEGGLFSGKGVYGNFFRPDSAGVGVHFISYRLPGNECTPPDSIPIRVNPFRPIDPDTIYPCSLIPTTLITPNQDQKNDFWEVGIINPGCINKASVEVYNRWGKSVYKSDNYVNDWDGTTSGKKLADGTYFFVIQYDTFTNEGKFSKTGFLTIHR